VIYQARKTTFPKTEKRVENMMSSGVFLTNFEVFGNVFKHYLETIFSIETKTKEKMENESVLIKIRDPNTVTVMVSFIKT